jgi:hypothetical protein
MYLDRTNNASKNNCKNFNTLARDDGNLGGVSTFAKAVEFER